LKLTEQIKKKVIREIAGVTLHYLKSDEYAISYVILRNENNKIKIKQSGSGIESLDRLANLIGKDTPVWISVSGRSVISRKITEDPGEKYLHAILPNAREAEFTVSFVKEVTGVVFVSTIRKDNLDRLAVDFHKCGMKIMGYSIGPAIIGGLKSSGLITGNTLQLPGYQVLFDDDQIKEIFPHDNTEIESYLIGVDRINSELLLPFASAFNYLIYETGYDTIDTESPVLDTESIFYTRLNKLFIPAALIFIFALLLINFFLFSHYSKKEQVLKLELSYQDALFAQTDSIRKEINLKKDLVNQLGLTQNSTFGFFSDRIAATVPNGITLNYLAINPPASKIKTEKPVQFEKLIRINGEATGSMVLNEWIKDLMKYNWIKEIEIIGYNKTDEKGEFEIKILYQ
jgi:hypothetical protein